VDKPQVCWCTYCGLPFVCYPLTVFRKWHENHDEYLESANKEQAHEHHRKHLESLSPAERGGYPLEPTGDIAEVNEAQKVTDEPFAQR
jgi:NADH dehydrogenase (ubiquinone) Fe-S protein 6